MNLSGKVTTKRTINGGKVVERGLDGVSPTVEVVETENGYLVKITDISGTKEFELFHGTGGGGGGESGISPVIDVSAIDGGTRITITDAEGKKTFDVMDGEDGYTPVKGVDYFDGDDGDDGEPGKSAYQYAKDGGYTGTEAQFAAKLAAEYPTKVSQLTNDSGFITASGAPVQSVNGKAGAVKLSAGDVGALPNTTKIPENTSDLTNDSGFLTGYTESDPTVPSWAKASTKPSYSKSEVGLANVDNVKQYSASNPPPYPVTSVNGKAGAIILNASDVGARPSSWTPSYTDVGADKSGAATSAVSGHNTNAEAHNDIRLLITGLSTRLDALANSDDDTLDQMAEVVAYIKANRDLIDQITTGKVSVSDIVNNLTTNVSNKPLSAAQGVALKKLIDAITVPTKVSQLTNDSGYITDYTETDPTVPAWAKASTKPSYSKSEVGLGNVDNVKQYSASNPPPYPVTSVNGNTGAVTLDAESVGARPSTWTPTAADVGAVPTSRTVNGKNLGANITLGASDVGAVPTSAAITVTGVDADGNTHTWTMYGVKN